VVYADCAGCMQGLGGWVLVLGCISSFASSPFLITDIALTDDVRAGGGVI